MLAPLAIGCHLIYTVQHTFNANVNSFKSNILHIEIMPIMHTILVFMDVNTHTYVINASGSLAKKVERF